MTAKRALVVDDSRSARISLQRLLEQYHITVDFAESGEEALDYLKHHLVDAIFMDHTMPGMDGLETVVAIKSNPRTATIPVMMYTAKEGEVYVSQARALGAIGVLPKQVQPGVLFEMLCKLGLVHADDPPELGAPASPVPGERTETARARSDNPERTQGLPAGDVFDAADAEYDQRALGASVQAVIRKVLNEQHLQLRSDILTAHREFARQVAHEILARERPAAAPVVSEPVGVAEPRPRPRSYAALLIVPLVILGAFCGFLLTERGALRDEATRLAATLREEQSALAALRTARVSDLDAQRAATDGRIADAQRALAWALNEDARVGFDEFAFDERRAAQLDALLGELARLGFRGTVRLEAHLGEFCLAAEPAGGSRLAAPDTPLDACAALGHPLDQSTFVEERMSASFASYLLRSPLVNEAGMVVEVVALDRDGSVAIETAPPGANSAGAWNETAARNHRVRYVLLPAGS